MCIYQGTFRTTWTSATSQQLRLETLGWVMTKNIPRKTTSPTSKSELFSTAADG
ncbi:hypothetical protein ACJW31_11G179300 [Castanea mollissima]